MDGKKWSNREHELLVQVLSAEEKFAEQMLYRTRGHFLLSHGLQSFVLESFVEASKHYDSPSLIGRKYYSQFIFEFSLAFRTIRACENVSLSGYPRTGYAMLRGLRDRILYLVANGLGTTSFNQWRGIREDMDGLAMEVEREEIRERAMKEERRVFNKVLRKATDLGGHLDALVRWDQLFNPEVHGDQFSSADLGMKCFLEGAGLPICPQFDMEFAAVYVNRSGDLGWMLLRLLPLMQPEPSTFSKDWADRWAILDDSFRDYNRNLTTSGKPVLTGIADGIQAFVDLRFNFRPDTGSYQTCRE